MSRSTYERLKAYCEASNISMSQLVETRVNDFLGEGGSPVATTVHVIPHVPAPQPVAAPRPVVPVAALPPRPTPVAAPAPRPFAEAPRAPTPPAAAAVAPLTSSAARSIVEPPPPIIKPRQQESAPKPAEKRPDQIFTF
ncbi:MAG: hypothetical protein KF773_09520 [Deltaproteobacteria bacterium]|nr:hypothetical protein [Deltaproteobacteria bacterium]MCW5803806.1 hypothetical protein [Deltaproteobacteria bacterium]